jgi:hypothetical protein
VGLPLEDGHAIRVGDHCNAHMNDFANLEMQNGSSIGKQVKLSNFWRDTLTF